MRRRSLLAVAPVALVQGLLHAGPAGTAASPRVVEVVARKFVFLPAEIELRRGQPVELALTAPEVVMGFFAPELKLRAVIVPGQVVRVAFTPERVGRFDFVCDIFCGDGHESMSGRIVVVD